MGFFTDKMAEVDKANREGDREKAKKAMRHMVNEGGGTGDLAEKLLHAAKEFNREERDEKK